MTQKTDTTKVKYKSSWARKYAEQTKAVNKPQQLVMVGGELQMRQWNPSAEEYDYADVPALAEYEKMKQQRDELLAACKELRARLDDLLRAAPLPKWPTRMDKMDTSWHYQSHHEALNTLSNTKAAIAKAEGRAE